MNYQLLRNTDLCLRRDLCLLKKYFKEKEYKYLIEFTNLLLIKRFDNNF